MLDQFSVASGYARLRRDLETLADEFEVVECPLFCQLIYPLVAAIDWTQFLRANDQADEWQEWYQLFGRDCRVRFFGDEKSLSPFTTLARRGFDLLLGLGQLKKLKGFQPPEGMVIELPAEQSHQGWLWLVFQTARCFSTATLQADPGFWNHSGPVDIAKVSAPFFEELRSNLFVSSAEAIRLWLDPSQGACVGVYIEDSPVELPPPPELDGPQLPDCFWFGGRRYKGFGSLEMRFLECVWGRKAVTIPDTMEAVYGDNADDKEAALFSLQKRINRKLLDQNAPMEVKRRDGRFYL